MGKIISSYIMPHPPIVVPEVGKGEEAGAQKTLDAMRKAGAIIKTEKPTTIVLTTSHGPVFSDYIYISTSPRLSGSLSRFRASGVKLEFENNTELVNRIIEYANTEGIYAGGLEDSLIRKYSISRELDHGAIVPLYFVVGGVPDFKLVHISIAGLPLEELYRFGMCISRAIDDTDERVVFIASGDLSHRLSSDGPYGFSERGEEFDRLFVKSVKNYDVKRLLKIDEGLSESAGECGLRSFIIMFGALDSYVVKPEVYSYEGPFGVGYAIARLGIEGRRDGSGILHEIEETDRQRVRQIREKEDDYIRIARESLEYYVKHRRIMHIPENLPEEMTKSRAGVFVSIKKHGQLRGCIGTISPTTGSIAEEIINNAVSAGTRDPRFDPVEEEELDRLVYSVDVLKKPEPVSSMDQLLLNMFFAHALPPWRQGLGRGDGRDGHIYNFLYIVFF
jgi:AmmeMemoRadiSam system protein A